MCFINCSSLLLLSSWVQYHVFETFVYILCSTTENLAIFIWENIRPLLPKPELLYEIKIHETDKNVVLYRGERV